MVRKILAAAALTIAMAPAFAFAQNATVPAPAPHATVQDDRPAMQAGSTAEAARYQDIMKTETSVLRVMQGLSSNKDKLRVALEQMNDLEFAYSDAVKGHHGAAAHNAEVEYTKQVQAVFEIARPLEHQLETQEREIRRLDLDADDVYIIQRHGAESTSQAVSDAMADLGSALQTTAEMVGWSAPELAGEIDPAWTTIHQSEPDVASAKVFHSDSERRQYLDSELPKRVHAFLTTQSSK